MKKTTYTLTDHIKLLLASNKWYLEKIQDATTETYQKKIFCVAVICNAWAALEGFINYVASITRFAKGLKQYEEDLLQEKEWKLNGKGIFEVGTHYYPTTKRLLFLLHRFSSVDTKKLKQSELWSDIKRAEDTRNIVVHPKEDIEERDISVKNAEFVDKTSRATIVYLKKNVLKSKYPIL